ncbi:MAG: VOC family protein [Aggregatilineales bacterium]
MIRIVWAEVPVRNLDRAVQFYQTVFDVRPAATPQDGARRTTTLTPFGNAGVPGFSLNRTKRFNPGDHRPLIYLDAGEDMTVYLRRIDQAGGHVIMPRTSLDGEAGSYATFLDTEGNLLALYAYP